MEKENKRYYIELEVLTPLSVGAGNEKDWIYGVDYVTKNGKVYIIDMERAVEITGSTQLANALSQGNSGTILDSLQGNNLQKASSRVFQLPAQTTNPIKSFLRTQLMDKPLIPGTSLKGAIRSCLFNHLHGRVIKDGSNDTNETVFGKMDDGSVFTRFIHVGDIIMPETQLVNTKIFNLKGTLWKDNWTGGWKNKGVTNPKFKPEEFNTLYECVVPGQVSYGIINIEQALYDFFCSYGKSQNYADKKKELIDGGIEALFAAINTVTKAYLQKELAFFRAFPEADRSDDIINSIQALLNKIPSEDTSCVLKMSAGSGFHSITGDWQYNNYFDEPKFWPEINQATGKKDRNAGKKRYKSRKIADYDGKLSLMGFVILRWIEDENKGKQQYRKHFEMMKLSETEEVALRKQKIEQQYNLILQEAQQLADDKKWNEAINKAEEAAKLLKENTDAQKLIQSCQANIQQELEQQYNKILQEAEQLADQKKWDEAINRAEEAKKTLPGKGDADTKIKEWEAAKMKQEIETSQVDKFKDKRLSDVLNPTTLAALTTQVKNWIKIGGNTFNDDALNSLVEAIKKLPKKKNKELSRGKFHELEGIIGKEWTDRLMKALNIEP